MDYSKHTKFTIVVHGYTNSLHFFFLYSNKIYVTRWRQNSPKDLKTKASELDKSNLLRCPQISETI